MIAFMQDAKSSFRNALIHAVRPWGVELESPQLELFEKHYAAIVHANEMMNLTRITEPVEAAIKHYADSLALLPWAKREGLAVVTLLDVGTGAGFPAVPIAVMRPDWKVTAIDGTRKKTKFVREVASELGLTNLKVDHGHSDHWETVERFDLVTTRAVASLARCMRTSHRFIKRGGRLIAYKTAALPDEENGEAQQACAELGMELESPFLYELELNAEKMARALVPVRRVF